MDLREQLKSKFEDASVNERALGTLRRAIAIARTAAFCLALAGFPAVAGGV